jgi:5-methylcytosine-specific restriction protein A
MTLRDTLVRVLSEYPLSKTQQFGGHSLAQFIRTEARDSVAAALGADVSGLVVEGSPGQGVWAAVPWIGVFDPAVTVTATEGFYVVYLFHTLEPVVHLSLNQGTTAVRKEFQSRTREVLADRAAFMRKRLADFAENLRVTAIELGSDARLPGDYSAGHALGFSYSINALPDEDTLRGDLRELVRAYRALTFRGGIEGDTEDQAELTSEFNMPAGLPITETRKYTFHRKIERNRTAAKSAKRFHGTTCQACNMSFAERYGPIGDGFIEAHHLKPIGSLEEGKPVDYDIATDFAVLCANCHRMIHKTDDPSDLKGFRDLVRP